MPASPPVICLMGPTASGKTGLAVELADALPLDIISVDSALVYRGMDIGTAKPDADTLSRAPHRLIDILEPEEAYSAGAFVRDACREIDATHAAGRVPLLVGGTMLYFRSLMDGIAKLPEADTAVREQLDREAAASGWTKLHAELAAVDPEAAARIDPNDRQRIQRALEVFRVSGRTLTDWQASAAGKGAPYLFSCFALMDGDRSRLHARINRRFVDMLDRGFLREVRDLMKRPGLVADAPSMRAVGYRQLWAHLEGECDLDTAVARAQAATRQLAKRQITWLRSAPDAKVFDPLEKTTAGTISSQIVQELNK